MIFLKLKSYRLGIHKSLGSWNSSVLSTEGTHPGGSVHTVGVGRRYRRHQDVEVGQQPKSACWFPSLAAEAAAGWPLFCSWIPVSPSQDSALVLEPWVEKMLGASPQLSLPVLGVSHFSFPKPHPLTPAFHPDPAFLLAAWSSLSTKRS